MTGRKPTPAIVRFPGTDAARALVAGLLVATGVAGLLLLSGGEAWGWWWLAATCLIAIIVRSDRAGVVAALLGAAAAAVVCAGPSLEGSGTPEGKPAWIALTIVAVVLVAAAALGLSLLLARIVTARAAPGRSRGILLAVVGLLLAAAAATFAWPAAVPSEAAPTPAPEHAGG